MRLLAAMALSRRWSVCGFIRVWQEASWPIWRYDAATEVIPGQDAEPGRDLHETRNGEMAALGEMPFGRYYGTVDATPVCSLCWQARTLSELVTLGSLGIWPNIEAALLWMDRYGDRDGDGFLEYDRQSSDGLLHQGWKDYDDAIFHADGSPAQGPIAVCEVQGYAYAAWRAGATMAFALGRAGRAEDFVYSGRDAEGAV